MPEPEITPDLIAAHGLKPEEYDRVLQIIGRPPSFTELGIFSAMWNEHCSYKSSRKWLRRLHTTGPQVICGPGENAGVVDIGDGQALVFKMESHNHPSFIEPYQGAATGVGGILRDVFTMGARPIAAMNALSFGDPAHPRTRALLSGVVAGIGGYGNAFGVPNIGGELRFHPSYNGNCLVNAFAAGLAPADAIFYAAASGVGMPVVYLGAKTGRDGVGGATMASAGFDDTIEDKRPTVQVGDPFTEKLLLEACLELMATDAIVAIQDMGAAGLTSSSVEMASKGKLGVELDLDCVPMREDRMTAYEIMLSESQERMLMVLRPEREAMAKAIFVKWDLDFAVIGRVTETGHLVVKRNGTVEADIPVAPLVANAPEYDRPREDTPKAAVYDSAQATFPRPLEHIWRELLAHPNQASKRWIWEQYDSSVMGDTLRASGGDAALVRVHGTTKALAMTTDCTPRYCQADPFEGGKQAVAESWRNIVATGARPLAITNNLNFGNPEKPRIMGQIASAVTGMGEACKALDYPVISGNVSLYNETNGQAILPTPVVGGVGLLADIGKALPNGFAAGGDTILLVGGETGWLGCSLYLQVIEGREFDAPPTVDLALERRNGEFVLAAAQAGLLTACHDVSTGGLLMALTEMALAGNVGASVAVPLTPAALFGEDQARYVITTRNAAQVMQLAAERDIIVTVLGETDGEAVNLKGGPSVALATLRQTHEAWLPGYMG
jgi:phosphoribosylformylglycinamidine synthase